MQPLLPVLPTDNLYRFLAFSGLLLTLLSYFFPYRNALDLKRQEEIFKVDFDELTAEIQDLRTRVEFAKRDQRTVDSIWTIEGGMSRDSTFLFISEMSWKDLCSKTYHDNQYRSYIEFMRANIDWLHDAYGGRYSLNSQYSEIDSLLTLKTSAVYELQRKAALLVHARETHSLLIKIAASAFWIGVVFASAGFALWYFKIQRPADIKAAHETAALRKPRKVSA